MEYFEKRAFQKLSCVTFTRKEDMNDKSTTNDQQHNPDIIVCPGCLHEQPEGPHFCAKCGAPLTAFSTVGPFERIFAQGHMFRRAVSGPTRPIVVIGMWVLLAPQLLTLAFTTHGIDSTECGGFLVFAAIALAYSVLLYRVTKNYINRRKSEKTSNH